MAIYDANWKSWCMYSLARAESTDLNWSAIELGYRQGIGLLQWTNDRSFNLLKIFYDRQPNLFTVQSLIAPLSANNQWSYKKFNEDECNNVFKILESSISKDCQRELFEKEVTVDIDARLRPYGFPNTKLGGQLAIMAENMFWVTGNWGYVVRLFESVGGKNGTTMAEILETMNNAPLAGRNTHGDRHDKVYKACLEWDGQSGKADFGNTSKNMQVVGDSDTRGDGVVTSKPTKPVQIPDGADPSTVGNTTTVNKPNNSVPITITSMQKRGNSFHVIGTDSNGKNLVVTMYKSGNNIYYPNFKKLNNLSSGTSGNDVGVRYDPPTPDEPNKIPQKPVIPSGKGGQGFVDLAKQYVGNLPYVWGDNGGDRFSLEDNMADCSSFVVSLFYKYTGVKLVNRSGIICSSTRELQTAGRTLTSGNNGTAGMKAEEFKLKSGDIIVVTAQKDQHDSAHVVIFESGSSSNYVVHCKGSAYGTVRETFDVWINSTTRQWFYFNRLFED